MAQEWSEIPMAELNDEAIRQALADESTPKPLRDAYEALQKQLSENQAETAQIKREAAFTKAGLSDLPHRSLFEKSYEGELTIEAIQEAAKEYGLVPDAAASAAAQDRAALDATRRIQSATSAVAPEVDDVFAALDRANNPAEILHVIQTRGAEVGVGLPPSVGGHRLV